MHFDNIITENELWGLFKIGIGAFLGFSSTYFVFRKQVSLADNKERNKIKRIREAIRAEIEELWIIYHENIGHVLELPVAHAADKLVSMKVFPTIYEENASYIAEIGCKEFVRKIIRFHSKIKELCHKIDIYTETPKEPALDSLASKLLGELHNKHVNFKVEVQQLLKLFEEEAHEELPHGFFKFLKKKFKRKDEMVIAPDAH